MFALYKFVFIFAAVKKVCSGYFLKHFKNNGEVAQLVRASDS